MNVTLITNWTIINKNQIRPVSYTTKEYGLESIGNLQFTDGMNEVSINVKSMIPYLNVQIDKRMQHEKPLTWTQPEECNRSEES